MLRRYLFCFFHYSRVTLGRTKRPCLLFCSRLYMGYSRRNWHLHMGHLHPFLCVEQCPIVIRGMALPYSFVLQRIVFKPNILQVQVPKASDCMWPWAAHWCTEDPVHSHRGRRFFPLSNNVVATVTKKPNQEKLYKTSKSSSSFP